MRIKRIKSRIVQRVGDLDLSGHDAGVRRGASGSKPGQRDVDWPVYTGQVEGQHYSPLTQINRTNVTKLKVRWTYDTGEEGIIETNPLIVRRVLYAYTPSEKVIALDAATGSSFGSSIPALRQNTGRED